VLTATAPNHRKNTAMTFAETALKIANMGAMLTHQPRRLKMPRPGAYGANPKGDCRWTRRVEELTCEGV
jgi:hypothetical protein